MNTSSSNPSARMASDGGTSGFMAQAINNCVGHVHPSFHEAENRGAEPAVLRFMGERLISEFMFNCTQNGIEPSRLSKKDLLAGVSDTLKGMVNPKRDQYASVSFDGFREFYRSTKHDFKAVGPLIAECHTQALIDALQATQSSPLLSAAERSITEGGIVREARVAASAYRAAGVTAGHVATMFRDNTDVAQSPVVDLIEKSVDEDSRAAMVRRSGDAKSQIRGNFPNPRPAWAQPNR